MVSVVPIKGEVEVSCALPIDVDFIVLSEDASQVLDAVFVDVFHTEIINDRCEADWAPFVMPLSWGDCALLVPGFEETFGEEVVCNYSSLWEAVHPTVHFTENVAVCVYFFVESIVINDILWE